MSPAPTQSELYNAAAALQARGITPTRAMNCAWIQLEREGTVEAHGAMPTLVLKNYLKLVGEKTS